MRVVDDLEVVEIHVHQRERPRIAPIAVQLLAEPVGERAGVQDVGERILYDETRHLRFSAPQGLEACHGEAQDGEVRQPGYDAPDHRRVRRHLHPRGGFPQSGRRRREYDPPCQTLNPSDEQDRNDVQDAEPGGRWRDGVEPVHDQREEHVARFGDVLWIVEH